MAAMPLPAPPTGPGPRARHVSTPEGERALAALLAALERLAHTLAAPPPASRDPRFGAELRPLICGLIAHLRAAGATPREAEARLTAAVAGGAPPALSPEGRARIAAVIASCNGVHARDLRQPAPHSQRAPRQATPGRTPPEDGHHPTGVMSRARHSGAASDPAAVDPARSGGNRTSASGNAGELGGSVISRPRSACVSTSAERVEP